MTAPILSSREVADLSISWPVLHLPDQPLLASLISASTSPTTVTFCEQWWGTVWTDPATGCRAVLTGLLEGTGNQVLLECRDGVLPRIEDPAGRRLVDQSSRRWALDGVWGATRGLTTIGDLRSDLSDWDGRAALLVDSQEVLEMARKAGLGRLVGLALVDGTTPLDVGHPPVVVSNPSLLRRGGTFLPSDVGTTVQRRVHPDRDRIVHEVAAVLDARLEDATAARLEFAQAVVGSATAQPSPPERGEGDALHGALDEALRRAQDAEAERDVAVARAERVEQDLRRERKAAAAAAHEAAANEAEEASGEDAPSDEGGLPPEGGDDEGPVEPLEPLAVPEEVASSRRFADVNAWAAQALTGVHVEEEAMEVGDLERQSGKVGTWVRNYAAGLALLDGWARSVAAGWEGNATTYADAVPHGLGADPVAMTESKETLDRPEWRRKRERPCCGDVADMEGGLHLFAAHVKVASGRHPAPRAHFDMGRDGRVHVGYVGPHLPTPTTRRLKIGHWR